MVAKISKGVTGGSDVLDGGGVAGGNKADAGIGLPPMGTRVRSSIQMRGDGVVLRAETRSSVALLAEERLDKH